MAMDVTYNGTKIIDSLEVTPPVDVTYNGSTIATLNAGNTKTLQCNGKVMASNIGIGGKTLQCSGKLMASDIVVELVGSATSGETWYFNDRISITDTGELYVNFTSNGVEYIAFYKQFESSINLGSLQYWTSSGEDKVYLSLSNNPWRNEAYRTIVLDEPATGEVLAVLEANAVRQ